VIAYMLVSGVAPFYGRNDAEIFKRVKACHWSFDAQVHRHSTFEPAPRTDSRSS
jgi:hypothetical protein